MTGDTIISDKERYNKADTSGSIRQKTGKNILTIAMLTFMFVSAMTMFTTMPADNWAAEKDDHFTLGSTVYTVTYHLNYDGSPDEDIDTVNDGEEYYITGHNEMLFSNPTGESFAGWSEQPDGSGERYEEGDPLSVTRNMDLYAVWEHEDNRFITMQTMLAKGPAGTVFEYTMNGVTKRTSIPSSGEYAITAPPGTVVEIRTIGKTTALWEAGSDREVRSKSFTYQMKDHMTEVSLSDLQTDEGIPWTIITAALVAAAAGMAVFVMVTRKR
jgi:hypothetical protein